MALDENEVKQLADSLIDRIHSKGHDFWIDPETHYQDHSKLRGLAADDIRTLHDLIDAFRNARSLFWKAFLGFAIVGSLILAAVGLNLGGGIK
jgi:hypothetical protein